MALAWLVVSSKEHSEFPECFAGCFSHLSAAWRQGTGAEGSRWHVLLVGGDPEPHAGQGWKPGLLHPFLGGGVGQQSLWKLEVLGGKAECREAGARLITGTDPHHLSCGSWPSFPALLPGTLEPLAGRRWEKGGWAAAASPKPLVAFFVSSSPHSSAARREVGAGRLHAGHGGRPDTLAATLATQILPPSWEPPFPWLLLWASVGLLDPGMELWSLDWQTTPRIAACLWSPVLAGETVKKPSTHPSSPPASGKPKGRQKRRGKWGCPSCSC